MDVRCNEKGELTLLWINRQIRGRIPKEIGQLQAMVRKRMDSGIVFDMF